MVRDDLYITVPSFFRCPISLDVMKSPVSLCTGVTYDRSSIQRWLDNGNNTCPATMQVLHTKDFVPNRTLKRLIQIWSDSVHHRVDSAAESSPPKPLLSQDQVLDLIRRLDPGSSESSSFDSLSKIVCFARESDENRRFVARADGFVPMLVEFLGNAADGGSRSVDLSELAVRALDMIRTEISDMEKVATSMLKQSEGDWLRSVVAVMQRGSVESRIGSARVLEWMAVSAEVKKKIGEKEEVLAELLKMINPEKDRSVMEAGISCLIAVSMGRRAKVRMVRLGVVKTLEKCLWEQDMSVSMTEKVLRVLEAVSSVREGRTEICRERGVVERVAERVLLKVSSVATELAVTVLWSVCYLQSDKGAQDAVEKANGVTKILLLMQSDCSPAVRLMSADLLKMFRLSSSNSSASFLSSYDTNTTHITPF